MLINHHFNVEIAAKLGIQSAVILDQFLYWIDRNKKSNECLINGRVWCQSSIQSLLKIFPYFTKNQIEYGIKKLKDNNVIIVEHLSKNKANRTNFYAFSDDFEKCIENKDFSTFVPFLKNQKSISENSEMYISENSEMYIFPTVSSPTVLSPTVQNSSTEEFCVPPTSQSEVVANAQNSPSENSHSSPNEEKTADEKIEHIENEIIEPEKTRLPEKTIDQNQDMLGSEQNALSVVKPKKVISTINAETLIQQFHIDPQTAHDFLAVRKAKKAPLTYRALQGIQREAEKINLTLEQALQICIERNWQGFQAHWLLKERNEILQSMTPEQKEKETQKAYAYIGKVLEALIAEGRIAETDYYKFGDIATEKYKECYSVEEAYQTMMNAINEQTQQQTAIGA